MATTDNIWETLLKESAKRVQLPEGAVLFLGDAGCGKSHLVSRLCRDVPADVNLNDTIIPDITAYDSFIASDVDETGSDSFSSSRVGVWSISNRSFKDALSLVLHPTRVDRLVVMIGIDLSKPQECKESLKSWLRFLRFHLEKFFSLLPKPEAASKKSQLLSYLATVRQQNNMNNSINLLHNYGVPLVVVGCKADLMGINDVTELKKLNQAQRDIRHICSRIGSALVYTSAENGKNCALLKKYLLHRLYSELIPMELTIEHSSADLFVPAGLDTDELIEGVVGAAVGAVLEQLISDDLSPTDNLINTDVFSVDSNVSNSENQPQLLEDEQNWLSNLHSEIEQSAAQAPSMPQNASTGGTFDMSSILANLGTDKPPSIIEKTMSMGVPADPEAKPVVKPSRRHSATATSASGTSVSGAKKEAPDDVKGFFESLMK